MGWLDKSAFGLIAFGLLIFGPSLFELFSIGRFAWCHNLNRKEFFFRKIIISSCALICYECLRPYSEDSIHGATKKILNLTL